MPPDLKTPEAALAVEDLIEDRRQLDRLKRWMSDDLVDRNCLILGSAPEPVMPSPRRYSRCVCINGSPWVAARHGLVPDLTVIAGYTTRVEREVSSQSLERLRGLRTSRLLFVTAGNEFEAGSAVLRERGFESGSSYAADPLMRAAILEDTLRGSDSGLGKRDDRVSNGLFAVVLALWLGARKVTLAGFSLAGGHSYIGEETPRFHVDGDVACLKLLAHRYGSRVTTTNPTLAAEIGLQLEPVSFAQRLKRRIKDAVTG
ncbi:hypothetical protein [Salinicola halophilus]|uniref:hypothetical protein n=1 Tax=Salinicola halophilus TaxID=184065 RepID=UPI000DA1D681|nr:hypothetical protein [Salinicola halophilus]